MDKKGQTMETYEAPRVEVIKVEVEKGFTVSGTGEIDSI